MRFSASILMAAFVLTACGGDGPTATPPDVDISGTYALVSINGDPLPFVFVPETDFGNGVTLVGGELVLNRDGTCSSTLFLVLSGDGLTFNGEEGDTCTYTVTGILLGLRWSDGSTGSGTLSMGNTEILIVATGLNLLYRKEI